MEHWHGPPRRARKGADSRLCRAEAGSCMPVLHQSAVTADWPLIGLGAAPSVECDPLVWTSQRPSISNMRARSPLTSEPDHLTETAVSVPKSGRADSKPTRALEIKVVGIVDMHTQRNLTLVIVGKAHRSGPRSRGRFPEQEQHYLPLGGESTLSGREAEGDRKATRAHSRASILRH